MTWETGSSDPQRLRAGYAVLSLGVIILLFAWGTAVWRGPQGEGELAAGHQKLEPPQPNRLLPAAGPVMMLSGAGLLVVLVLSVVAFLRISRSYRRHLLRSPPEPTPTSDVWQMHKVPNMPDQSDQADENE